VESLLRTAVLSTRKPLVAYPNSGESYDAARKAWSGIAETERWGELGRRWRDAGARLLGGCCRTGPDEVRRLRDALS
jgi:homocysteine S-methyltransferase